MNKNNIYIIPDKDNLDEYTDYANKHGFHFEYNDFFVPDFLDNKEDLDKRIALYTNFTNLPSNNTMHGSFLDVTIFSADKAIREHSRKRLRESMDIAKKLNAKAVIMHTNYIPNFLEEYYLENWVDQNELFIRELLKDYPDICIYMENMFDMVPEQLLKLAEKLKDEPNFGICFDYAHATVFGSADTLYWAEKLAPYVKHVHINDNDTLHDQHLALGDGKIDIDKFIDIYEKYFPDSSLLLEMNGLDKIIKSVDRLF